MASQINIYHRENQKIKRLQNQHFNYVLFNWSCTKIQARFLYNNHNLMSLNLTIEELKYLICPRNNHHEELSQVCTDKKCHSNALICPLCEDSEHHGHPTIPLRQFLSSIDLLDDQTAIRMGLGLQLDLAALQEKFKEELERVRQEFLQSTYELETKVTSYFSHLSERYYESFQKRSQTHFAQALTTALSSPKSEELENLVNKHKNYSQISLPDELHFYRLTTEKKLQEFLTSLSKLNFKEQVKMLINTLVVPAQSYNYFSFNWSSLKAPTITINGSVATQKASNSAAERFALLESKSNNYGDIKMKFKINKLKGWIGVGICLREKIVKAGYKFNYTVPEHGSYLISANGYSWSHSRPEYNSTYKSFIFHEGDVITVDYSVLERKVSFESRLTGSKFYLSTVICPTDDCYVPCANLCNTGDEVEIINDLD